MSRPPGGGGLDGDHDSLARFVRLRAAAARHRRAGRSAGHVRDRSDRRAPARADRARFSAHSRRSYRQAGRQVGRGGGAGAVSRRPPAGTAAGGRGAPSELDTPTECVRRGIRTLGRIASIGRWAGGGPPPGSAGRAVRSGRARGERRTAGFGRPAAICNSLAPSLEFERSHPRVSASAPGSPRSGGGAGHRPDVSVGADGPARRPAARRCRVPGRGRADRGLAPAALPERTDRATGPVFDPAAAGAGGPGPARPGRRRAHGAGTHGGARRSGVRIARGRGHHRHRTRPGAGRPPAAGAAGAAGAGGRRLRTAGRGRTGL